MTQSYLEERSPITDNNNTAERMDLTAGVPRGSILGPALWNIFFDDVLRLELPKEVTVFAFADDLAIVARGKTESMLQERTTYTIEMIADKVNNKQLLLATRKTEMVILYGGYRLKIFEIEPNRHKIVSGEAAKYLGVVFGHNMTFRKHVRKAVDKAEASVVALSRFMPNYGGPSAGKGRLYHAIMERMVGYGIPIWGDVIGYSRYRKMLLDVQRKILIRTAMAYRTVSTEALQVITGIPLLDLLIEAQCELSMTRTEKRQETIRNWQKR